MIMIIPDLFPLLLLWKGPDICEITDIHSLHLKVERIQTSGERTKKTSKKTKERYQGLR